jgi:hypothetical protein
MDIENYPRQDRNIKSPRHKIDYIFTYRRNNRYRRLMEFWTIEKVGLRAIPLII